MPNGLAPALRLPRHLAPRSRETERRRQRRLGRRLAQGFTPAQAARSEGLPEAEVRSLLADPEFAALVEAYREIRDQPEARQRDSLRRMCRLLLTEAAIDGDLRVACFVFREEARGRDPAVTLADGVLRAARRPAAPPAPTPIPQPTPPSQAARPAPPRPPADPVDRAAWRTAAELRDAVVAEQAVLHRATAAPAAGEPAPAVPTATPGAPAAKARKAAASPAQTRPVPNRHERRRSAALRRIRDGRTGGPTGNRGPPR